MVSQAMLDRSDSASRPWRKNLNVHDREGCTASGGAQAELHALRDARFKTGTHVSQGIFSFHSLPDPPCLQVWYMIRNRTLLRRKSICHPDQHKDLAVIEALMVSTIARFDEAVDDADFIVLLGDLVVQK